MTWNIKYTDVAKQEFHFIYISYGTFFLYKFAI